MSSDLKPYGTSFSLLFLFAPLQLSCLMCLFSCLKSALSIKQAKQTMTKHFYHKNQIGQQENIDDFSCSANVHAQIPYILCQYAPAYTVWNSKRLKLCCPKGACAIVKYTVPRHTCAYHKEEITKTLSYI